MHMESWQSWSTWSEFDQFDGVPEKPGVYIIATRQPINRVAGRDRLGILTIGETDNLRKRLRMFWSCVNDVRHRGHNAGWRFRELDMQKRFRPNSLVFRWKTTLTKNNAYHEEGLLLKKYASEHLELPPLNYKYNWSVHGEKNAAIGPPLAVIEALLWPSESVD